MSNFLLVIVSLLLFALGWFVYRLSIDVSPNRQLTGNPDGGCWEGGGGVGRKRPW
jgi:hypothetical protein